MLRLIVVRHAKSSWNDPWLDDHDRPLAPRGARASEAIGKWLARGGHEPRAVLSSTSTRTRETWQGIAACLDGQAEARFLPELYHCGPDGMLRVLRKAAGSPALLLAHNPGIAEFASLVLAERPGHPDFHRYPTAATLVCDLPCDDWGDARFRTGTLVDFVVPRDLE